MAKSILRQAARELRDKGLGIKTIAHKLGVSSSSVSLWCRDIVLNPEQIKELERRSHDPRYGRRLEYAQRLRETKNKKIHDLLEEGKREIGTATKRELFVAGIALYWAEGFKKDNLVGFSNSDPAMIAIFTKWLHLCGVAKNRLKFRVGVNEAYRDKIHDIERYWKKALHIPPDQFQKPFFQRVQWKKVYDRPKEYHGVLRVRVAKSTDLLRKIRGWIEGFKIWCLSSISLWLKCLA